MAIREIRTIGDNLIRKKAREVEIVDNKIREILDDMLETMRKSDGIGLAAPQVGILKRIIVIDVDDKVIKLINPVIKKQSGDQICEEGCLSVPEKIGEVERPFEVWVEGLNEYGEKVQIHGKELIAVALCHEIDHLDGVLFIDKADPYTIKDFIPQVEEENKYSNNKKHYKRNKK